MTRVHVWGASGYAGAETVKLLERHPIVQLGAIESASHAGQPVGAHFPQLRKSTRTFDGSGAVGKAIVAGDVVIMGGPHGAARTVAPVFLGAGARVIDLSADFRTSGEGVYGFPERYAAAIATATLVANPGCYPTATLLAALPLAAIGTPVQLIVDAKSGITGAGRTPAVGSLFAEVQGDVRAYGLNGHRHQPEIVQELEAMGCAAPLLFTPHVVPISRGMLADVYAIFAQPADAGAVAAAYRRTYLGNPFVRVLEPGAAPSVVAVAGTNDAEIAVSVHGNVVRAICAIDNLGKGAAGQAVQNLNIMLGIPQEVGLEHHVSAV